MKIDPQRLIDNGISEDEHDANFISKKIGKGY